MPPARTSTRSLPPPVQPLCSWSTSPRIPGSRRSRSARSSPGFARPASRRRSRSSVPRGSPPVSTVISSGCCATISARSTITPASCSWYTTRADSTRSPARGSTPSRPATPNRPSGGSCGPARSTTTHPTATSVRCAPASWRWMRANVRSHGCSLYLNWR
ncbi:hypothetical protein ACFPM0_28530 [Pseudonocardia sulfidoxydans]|uniref:hypothetical protein n=1 Tax=Pseudonocardia sulfidoxydans TaxID=54011 RepID=UPI0036173678